MHTITAAFSTHWCWCTASTVLVFQDMTELNPKSPFMWSRTSSKFWISSLLYTWLMPDFLIQVEYARVITTICTWRTMPSKVNNTERASDIMWSPSTSPSIWEMKVSLSDKFALVWLLHISDVCAVFLGVILVVSSLVPDSLKKTHTRKLQLTIGRKLLKLSKRPRTKINMRAVNQKLMTLSTNADPKKLK